ncbi:MAG: YceD family protein [Acidimicrobiales bacterium]
MSRAGERPAGEERSAGGASAAPSRRGRQFKLNVRGLRARSGARHEVHFEGSIPGLFVSDAKVPDDAEIRFDGWVESTIGGVTVAGTVLAPWSGVCRRCLASASGVLATEIREFCRDSRSMDGAARLGPKGEDEAYAVGPDELDVEPIVRDACILELPLAPLCSESCLGLCPTCGANRNRDECPCDAPIDERWSALVGLNAERIERADAEEDLENTQTEQEAE